MACMFYMPLARDICENFQVWLAALSTRSEARARIHDATTAGLSKLFPYTKLNEGKHLLNALKRAVMDQKDACNIGNCWYLISYIWYLIIIIIILYQQMLFLQLNQLFNSIQLNMYVVLQPSAPVG